MKVLSTSKNTVRDVAWKASGLGELKEKKCFLPLKVKVLLLCPQKTQ